MKNIQVELNKELLGEETLIWSGVPKQGFIMRQIDYVFIPFTMFTLGFAIYWLTKLLAGDILFFILFSPFILLMSVMIVARYLMDRIRRKNTIYGLTKTRLIIISGIFSKSVKSVNIAKIEEIELREKENKYGTIFLDPNHSVNDWNEGAIWWFGRNVTPKIEMIPNVREVFNLLIEIQNA